MKGSGKHWMMSVLNRLRINFQKTWPLCTGKPAVLALFLLCALPVGMATTLITPPGQSPDEIAHTARALGLLHGAILGTRINDTDPATGQPQHDAGVMVDAGIFSVVTGNITRINDHAIVTNSDYAKMVGTASDHHLVFAPCPNTIVYVPTAYVPAVLGFAAGLLFNASPYICFELGRAGMLLAFIMLGGLAIWVTAYGEAVLLTVLLLPMTLFLAGTINQDGVWIAAVCLACAALSRAAWRYWLFGLILFTLFLCAKSPYILMFGVFLLPRFGRNFWRRARAVAIAAIPVMIWGAIVSLFFVVPFIKGFYHPGPYFIGDQTVTLDHSDPPANLHILLADPTRFITLPLHSIQLLGIYELHMAVGILGQIDVKLGGDYYVLWGIACLAAVIGQFFTSRPSKYPFRADFINALQTNLLIIATIWLIMILLYIDWTNIGMDWIDGLQGRYLLPLFPFLLFAVPRLPGRLELPPLVPAIPALLLGFYDLAYLPTKLMWSYYLH